jgi:hypothetical protein
VTRGWRHLHNEEFHNLYFTRYYDNETLDLMGMQNTRDENRHKNINIKDEERGFIDVR